MAAPVIIPELQFIDADGHPYAGGTLETYIVGTTTPKQTWVDPDGTALQTNPAILDAAGRCLMWGDGLYRLILRDAAGNLIWDQPATTLVSAAMAPVIAAPTIADAVHLLGLDGTVTAAELASAISTEQAARIAADNTLQTNINNEVTRAEAAEANLQSQIDTINAALSSGHASPQTIQRGAAITDGSAHVRVTFDTPYASQPAVVATCTALAADVIIVDVNADNTGFDAWTAYGNPSVTPFPGNTIFWVAVGPT